MSHVFPIRVYYEDTDMAGIVYHANYLRYIERARSDWVREIGIDQLAMKVDGIVFAVRRIEADYIATAQFDDRLEVHTTLTQRTAARMVMVQNLYREGTLIFAAEVTIVCIGAGGKPVKLPANLCLLPLEPPQ